MMRSARFVSFFLLTASALHAEDAMDVARLRDALPAEARDRLTALARQAVRATSAGERTKGIEGPQVRLSCGVFVTLVGKKGVRGCYGSLDGGAGSLEQSVVEAALGAAGRDVRFTPVKPSEVDRLTVIVSLVLPREPVSDWRTVDPDRYGLLITSGGKSAVILPGEARTASWEVSETLQKAGIKAGAGEPITAFSFRTLTLVSRGLP